MRIRYLVGPNKGKAEHIRHNIGQELLDAGHAEKAGWTDESNKAELATHAEYQVGDKVRLVKDCRFSEEGSNHKYYGNFRTEDVFTITKHEAICSSNGVLDDVAYTAEHEGRFYFIWDEFGGLIKVE